jgi:hypothetical protein
MSSMSRPLNMPSTHRRSPATWNAPSSVATSAFTPAGLCAPSTTIIGLREMSSMRPGIRAFANVDVTRLLAESSTEERFGRDDGRRGVHALVDAVQRDQDSRRTREGRAQRDRATAERQFVLFEREGSPSSHSVGAEFVGASLGDLHDDGVGRGDDGDAVGAKDTDLVTGDLRDRRAQYRGVIEVDVGEHRDVRQ